MLGSMKKPDRKRMDEVLLRERLGLDDDWLNRDEKGVAHIPKRLPAFIRRENSEEEVAEVEAAMNRLVAAGCRRQALYFCLQELSPAAERSRKGLGWVYDKGVPVKAWTKGVPLEAAARSSF